MGKHTVEHGRSKYVAVGTTGEYRVQHSAKPGEGEAELAEKVRAAIGQMDGIQRAAADMLKVGFLVLNSPTWIIRPAVVERIKALFLIGDGKPGEDQLKKMLAVLSVTRTGLANDQRVKFKRLTSAENEKNADRTGWTYGATSVLTQSDFDDRKYVVPGRANQIATYKEGFAEVKADPDYSGDRKAIAKEHAKLGKMIQKVEALERRGEKALATGDGAKFVRHAKDGETQYAGMLKLDMFTFVTRVANGEQMLVARTLVHEATHRYAATEDHAYCTPDGSGFKNGATPTPAECLENADSYAFFCFAMQAAARRGDFDSL